MTEPVLRIRGLEIEGLIDEKWRNIVRGIDLDLNKGEVFGLIGESGAGKSTIGLAAMGYTRSGCRISGGSVEFDGVDLVRADTETLRKLRGQRIAYVAQSAAAAFNPAHRLIQQFCEVPVIGRGMKMKDAREKGIDMFRKLRLPDPETFGSRFPHQVSGGQLQRAMVAMATAADPDIIIFDEPTTALDVTTQIEVLAAIKAAIQLTGMAALYITHDLAVVSQVADKIMVLKNGDIVETGATCDLMECPAEEYTEKLLSVRSSWDKSGAECSADDTLLCVKHLSAGYTKAQKAVDDVTFDMKKGSTVAVVGESGSGKTTLARVLTGLLPASEGTVEFKGAPLPRELKSRSRESLRALQMIYQMPDVALNPRQKVRKIIGRPLSFYFGTDKNKAEKRIAELLEMTGLAAGYIDRYPTELSGGEKQRVCIARALAADPDLIICDEVTSALDQLVAEEILDLLLDLQKELGVSYLFITHDLALVNNIADEVLVMLNGKVVEQGTKQEIFTPPHHEYTELLLSCVPEMDPQWLDKLLSARDNPVESKIYG